MNMREARAYVLRCMAAEARHHVSNGSAWLERPSGGDGLAVGKDGQFSDADYQRVVNALNALAEEMERRSARLSARRDATSTGVGG